MGTRSTLTISRDKAMRVIRSALDLGLLSDDALSDIVERVSDTESPESYNFRIVPGDRGPDDDWWYHGE